MHNKAEKLAAFSRLIDILDELREKCPWDRKQTNESLRPNTIEETYELCEALVKDIPSEICKELGDVLLHVLFYAKIGSEKQLFDIADVCNRLSDKLVFRHPHVFPPEDIEAAGAKILGSTRLENENDVAKMWEKIKQVEKDGNATVLSGVPSALPSLIKAYRIQEKARNVGFDWDDRSQVWEKVKEEIAELEKEWENGDARKAEHEFGDVLFSLVNAARLYKINPDNAIPPDIRKRIPCDERCDINGCIIHYKHIRNISYFRLFKLIKQLSYCTCFIICRNNNQQFLSHIPPLIKQAQAIPLSLLSCPILPKYVLPHCCQELL